jgi:hypothetical protein
MREKTNTVGASLILTSKDRSPDEVSALTGLRQSKVWMAGDLIAGTTRPYGQNGWALESGFGSDADLEGHVRSLVETIRPVASVLKELAKDWDIEMSCTAHANSYVPALHFDRETVQVLAAIGAQIDIDLYCG